MNRRQLMRGAAGACIAVSPRQHARKTRSSSDKFDPNYSSMEGFVTAKMFVEAARRAGNNLSADGLAGALNPCADFNLGGFFVDFGPAKHTGSKFVELTILLEDGRVRR